MVSTKFPPPLFEARDWCRVTSLLAEILRPVASFKKGNSMGIDVKAKKVIYFRGRRHGILEQDASTITLQRVGKTGQYIHSPFKIRGKIVPKKAPK